MTTYLEDECFVISKMSRIPRFDYVLVAGIFNKMNNIVLEYLNHGVAHL